MGDFALWARKQRPWLKSGLTEASQHESFEADSSLGGVLQVACELTGQRFLKNLGVDSDAQVYSHGWHVCCNSLRGAGGERP